MGVLVKSLQEHPELAIFLSLVLGFLRGRQTFDAKRHG